MKKRITLLMFLVCFAFILTACTGKGSISGLSITGLTGTGSASDPYLVSMLKEETKSMNVDVQSTGEVDTTILVSSSDENIVQATLDNHEITVSAKAVGTATLTVTIKDQTEFSLSIQITVTEESTEVLVTSIFVNADEGSGTESDPYLVTVSSGKDANISYTVRPTDATDKTFTWTAGSITDGVFTAETSDIASVLDDNAGKLTISGLKEGVVFFEGTSNDDSDIKVYVKVSVESYVEVTGIELSGVKENEGAYELETALNTNWNMSLSELVRKQTLLDGGILGGLQAPDNLTYWPTLSAIGIQVLPAGATDSRITISYSEEGIISIDVNSGSFVTLKAGETDVTIASYSNPEAKVTLHVTVNDSLYPGILTSTYENTETSPYTDWNFDSDHGSETQLAKIHEWNLVMVQTTSNDPADTLDQNQKAFYLGNQERIYGICLESHLASTGDMNTPTAIMWNKIKVSDTATSLDILIGPNDRLFGEFSVSMITEDGTVYVLKDRTGFTQVNTAVRYSSIAIPEALRSQTVALVISSYLTEYDNNAELQIKGVWINDYTPVTDVTIPAVSGEYGQGSTFNLGATVVPSNASYPGLTYAIDKADQGVSVSQDGTVEIGINATVGEYVITVKSTDNDQIVKTYTLNVVPFVQTTTFILEGIANDSIMNATYGSGGYGNNEISFTTASIKIQATFNADASLKTYEVTQTGDSAVIENGYIVVKGVGDTTFTLKATNTELTVTFTVKVSDYDTTKLEEGISSSDVASKETSTTTLWNDAASLSEWSGVRVDTSHVNSKVPFVDGNIILFESHATSANTNTPIALIWNKVSIAENINSLVLQLRSHDDDRILESSNFRVLVLSGENYETSTELIGWTTVANRWHAANEIFSMSLDVSSYAGEDVIIVIEHTGSLQNNGNYPLNSDSAAGAYLHLQSISLQESVAPSLESQYSYRLYGYTRTGELATDWNAIGYYGSSSRFGGLYDESSNYLPFVLNYDGPLDTVTTLTLPTTSLYISNQTTEASPLFYPWGIYPALNDSEVDNSVTFELVSGTSVTLVDGVLTPVELGDSVIRMGVKKYASDEMEYFTFTVSVTNPSGNVDPDPTESTEWLNKDDIFDQWTLVGNADMGVGEGADLVVGSGTGWSALTKEITLTNLDKLTFTARVFARDGETYPDFVVKVNGVIIRAIGQTQDFVHVDTDAFQTFSYDLSAYRNQTVTIELGITTGTHAVVGSIILGELNTKTSFMNKDDIVDNFTLTGNADYGVGEGADLVVGSSEGWSSWSREIYINEATSKLTFTARVFVRDGETYPLFVIKVDGVIVRAIGAADDAVLVNTDDFMTYSYDLSAYVGNYHTVEVGIITGTHAVVGSISFDALNGQTAFLNKDDIIDNFTLTGNADYGVGEGADLVVGSSEGWSSWGKEFYINEATSKLTFTARVFARDGETYPTFVIKVDGQIVIAIGQTTDSVLVNTDEFQTFSYDLSAFLNGYHTVEVGITTGTHAVVGSIVLSTLE